MFTRINSSGIQGIGAYPVSVEADVANGLPGFSISGQLSTEVREAQERWNRVKKFWLSASG